MDDKITYLVLNFNNCDFVSKDKKIRVIDNGEDSVILVDNSKLIYRGELYKDIFIPEDLMVTVPLWP